jgi:DNA polymerase-3 subunit delta'|tara:strand:- start:476 stop:1462 length:987 start_codon:yes stop_codon:yes gene_type:complete
MKKVIGFDQEFDSILNQLLDNKLSNSLLLTGNKGVGKKYFILQIIEEYINKKVVSSQTQHHLSLLKNNSHPNIIIAEKEIDEKTKKLKNFIVIDQIRKINQFCSETSIIEDIPKFILIDCADDMNINASNALLKILEEPKLNTYFFLISHQPSSLLPTIKSRCLKINLPNHNYDNFSNIIEISNNDINEETKKFLYDITNGSPGLINEYEFDEILNIFERLINLIEDKDPFSESNNDTIKFLSSLDNDQLKIFLSFIKFILITINKIKLGINITKNYLSDSVLKIQTISDKISSDIIQRKLDYLINNENDLFTFNLDKKIFMINFITE